MSEKIRLDTAIFERGLTESREKARTSVMAGIVYVNNQKADKPGMQVKPADVIEVRGKALKYVSRGGLKLEKAVKDFDLDLSGKVCADVGSSTGGFTDCMLQNGAAHVYAIDVGHGQLAWSLRNDQRVTVMEDTNIRYVDPYGFDPPVEFCTIDVNHISLRLVLPVVKDMLGSHGELVCLIKPEFEAGRDKVGKNGIVRESAVHEEVLRNTLDFMLGLDFKLLALDFSPIKGQKGNIEYLCYACPGENSDRGIFTDEYIRNVVEMSHMTLDKRGKET